MTCISAPKLAVLALTFLGFWYGILFAVYRNNQLDARLYVEGPIVQSCVQHSITQRVTVSPP